LAPVYPKYSDKSVRCGSHDALHSARCPSFWLERQQALWTFAYLDEVDPTSNRAERALRPAVIKRKLSFGTQSSDGSRFIERMLTVCETLRRQGRSVLDFLVESLETRRHDATPPTLMPT